jgi:S-adenosylmethionine synthetase
VAGKNPVSHVGKIYNLLTHHIAHQIYPKVDGLEEVYIWLLSQIDKPIDLSAIAAAQVIMKSGNSFNDIHKEIDAVVDTELENIDRFCNRLAKGEFSVY